MSRPREREPQSLSREPVVGVVAMPDSHDDIERVCLRARAHGLNVLIAWSGDVQDVPDVVESPETVVVPVSRERNGPLSTAAQRRRLLETYAREQGASQLIFVDDISAPIDFERTLDSPTEYVVEGVPVRENDTNCLVAIPAYNEEQTVRAVVEGARAHVDDVLVIDDGSSDNTTREAWRGGADVVVHEQNGGYGAALQTAFDVASERDADSLVILDGDGQHDPADIPRLLETLEREQTDIAIGSRFVGSKSSDIPLYRRFGLLVINVLTNLSLARVRPESWIHDTQSGFRAYDRDAIDTLSTGDAIGDDMGASLDILYQVTENGLSITEYPVVVDYDTPSESTHNPVAHGLGLVQTILTTTIRRYGSPVVTVPAFVLLVAVVGFLSHRGSPGASAGSDLSTPLGTLLVGVLLVAGVALLYGGAKRARS